METLLKWAASWQNQQNECAPSEDSDQPGHPPSLIRVFAVHSIGSLGPKVSSCGQRRLWSDWADVFAGRTVILLVLSWGGSFDDCHSDSLPGHRTLLVLAARADHRKYTYTKWTTPWENLAPDVCDEVRLKPVSSATDLESLSIAKLYLYYII